MTRLDKHIKEFQELVNQLDSHMIRKHPGKLTTMDITVVQFVIGMVLRDHGSMTMGELAEYIRESLPSVSGVVDRMVKHRLVARGKDAQDRRIVRVRLTSQGIKVINKIEQHKHEHLKPVMTVLNNKDRETFLQLMRKIVHGLRESSQKQNQIDT